MTQQFRMVQDLVVPAQGRVLVLDGVKAVRTARDDLLRAHLIQRGDIGLGHLLVEILVTQAPGRVAGARLARTEDAKVHPGAVQHARRGFDLFAPALVERARAPHPVEVLDVVGDRAVKDRHLKVQRAQPLGALARTESPWISLILHVAQQERGFGGEPRLHQHFVAAHVDDGVDVLDVHGALLHAGATRRARPEHVGVDRGGHQRRHGAVTLIGEQPIGRGEHVVAQPHDEQFGTERLAGRPGRTDALASAALGARRQIQHLLPSEVLDLARAKDRVLTHLFHVHVGRLVESAQGPGSTRDTHVDRGQEDVQVFRIGDEHEKAGDDRDVGE